MTQLRFFYLDCPLTPSASVSPVWPEVRQSVLRVVDFMEDNFGVDVKHVDAPFVDYYRDVVGDRGDCLDIRDNGEDDEEGRL